MYTQVGQVTRRRGARLHAAINGLAYCGAGTGRILGAARDITEHDATHLCRRCRKALVTRLTLDRSIVARRADAGSRRLVDAIDLALDLVDPVTDDDLAMLAAIADTIRDCAAR